MSEIDERVFYAHCKDCINNNPECIYCKMTDKGPSQYQPRLKEV